MRRRLIVSLAPALLLFAGCGDSGPNEFDGGDSGTATGTGTGTPMDMAASESGTMDAGDGDGDPGDGDGDPGDGDGDPPTDTGVGMCGDGVVDIGEQCDGDDLNGFTCADLGYAGGELACDPVTCTYDATACITDMDGGSGGTTG